MSEAEVRTVAVLGTGIMGAAMARNLARAGHTVRAWNRSRDKAEPLAADGVHVATTPAEAVEGVDVVLTMLHDGPAVLDVIRQASPALRPGIAWVQSTTSGLDDVAELAAFAHEQGLIFFDSPVSGTRQPAEAGKLLVLAAGLSGRRPLVTAILDAVGARTLWIGEDGARGEATRLKLVVNSWVVVSATAAGEILALADALGVDSKQFFHVIDGGLLDMAFLKLKAGLITDGGLAPASFAVGTAAKDARLIVEAGTSHGVRLDAVSAAAERLDRAVALGHGAEDLAATYYASFEGDEPLR